MRKVVLLFLIFAAAASAKGIVSTIDAPDTNISGLAWGNGSLWAVDAVTDYVYELDPATGTVISSFYFNHTTTIVPTGLAYSEGQNMLYCGGWYGTTGYVFKYNPDGTYQGMVDMCGG
jgi:outer membrane protein assembly factor BamB